MKDKKKTNLTIKRVSMVDQVCENIKTIIISGDLGAGDKLPSESELADMFGVNRLTVRMALQKLSTLGIVETRVGEGSFVRDFSFIPYLTEVSDVYLSSANLEEVRGLRMLIELECTKLAIKQSTPEEMEKLRHSLEVYLDAVADYRTNSLDDQERLGEVVERDLDFHYQICRNSHNALLKDLFKLLRPLIKQHLASLFVRRNREWDSAGRPDEGVEPHEQLYNNIVSKDWKSCKKIYLELIDFQPTDELDA